MYNDENSSLNVPDAIAVDSNNDFAKNFNSICAYAKQDDDFGFGELLIAGNFIQDNLIRLLGLDINIEPGQEGQNISDFFLLYVMRIPFYNERILKKILTAIKNHQKTTTNDKPELILGKNVFNVLYTYAAYHKLDNLNAVDYAIDINDLAQQSKILGFAIREISYAGQNCDDNRETVTNFFKEFFKKLSNNSANKQLYIVTLKELISYAQPLYMECLGNNDILDNDKLKVEIFTDFRRYLECNHELVKKFNYNMARTDQLKEVMLTLINSGYSVEWLLSILLQRYYFSKSEDISAFTMMDIIIPLASLQQIDLMTGFLQSSTVKHEDLHGIKEIIKLMDNSKKYNWGGYGISSSNFIKNVELRCEFFSNLVQQLLLKKEFSLLRKIHAEYAVSTVSVWSKEIFDALLQFEDDIIDVILKHFNTEKKNTCPITFEFIINPVTLENANQAYDLYAIKKHFETQNENANENAVEPENVAYTSPMTNAIYQRSNAIPALTLNKTYCENLAKDILVMGKELQGKKQAQESATASTSTSLLWQSSSIYSSTSSSIAIAAVIPADQYEQEDQSPSKKVRL